jgi:hypothetical protein
VAIQAIWARTHGDAWHRPCSPTVPRCAIRYMAATASGLSWGRPDRLFSGLVMTREKVIWAVAIGALGKRLAIFTCAFPPVADIIVVLWGSLVFGGTLWEELCTDVITHDHGQGLVR